MGKSFFSIMIVAVSMMGTQAWAQSTSQGFMKLDSPTLEQENRQSTIKLENPLQPVRQPTTDMLRAMIGAPVSPNAAGPAVQGEWSHRLGVNNPVFASAGFSYFQINQENEDGTT